MALPAGTIPPNPSELLGSQRMRDLIATLTQTHRVILDAPPLLSPANNTEGRSR